MRRLRLADRAARVNRDLDSSLTTPQRPRQARPVPTVVNGARRRVPLDLTGSGGDVAPRGRPVPTDAAPRHVAMAAACHRGSLTMLIESR
jgi:hypothetical protein